MIQFFTAVSNFGSVSLCGDTILDKNEAKTAGGAVYISASTLTVVAGCPTELNNLGNTSIISGNAAPKGGAMYIVGASTVNGGTEAGANGPHLIVTGNKATGAGGSGGGIAILATTGSIALRGAGFSVHGNMATRGPGGGLSIDGGGVYSSSMTRLEDVSIKSNTAHTNGGGISIKNNASVTVSGEASQAPAVIAQNSATDGGAVHIETGGRLMVKNTLVAINIASANGGGFSHTWGFRV